jgi:hypothetical protein
MAQMPAMGQKRTSLKIHSLQFATAPVSCRMRCPVQPLKGNVNALHAWLAIAVGEAIFELGMRPTSEAWPMSARGRHGAPAVGSVKIAAGVTSGHPHNFAKDQRT